MSADVERIVVVAAVVEQQGRFLIGRRLRGTHLAGLWEFPGGKVHAGETLEGALRREIEEELGARLDAIEALLHVEHAYPERIVALHFFRARLSGQPRPMLGQELRWATRAELGSLDFPPADAELIGVLSAEREDRSSSWREDAP